MDLDDSDVEFVASSLQAALEALPRLKMLVLSLSNVRIADSRLGRWFNILASNGCLQDKRFTLVPFARGAEQEWKAITSHGRSVWDRAEEWKGSGLMEWAAREEELLKEAAHCHIGHSSRDVKDKDRAWEIDLVERDGYTAPVTDPARHCE